MPLPPVGQHTTLDYTAAFIGQKHVAWSLIMERGAGCLVEPSNLRGAGIVELAAATELLPWQNMLNSCRRECKCFLRTMKNDNKKNHNEMLSVVVNEKPANVFILFTLPESFKKRH